MLLLPLYGSLVPKNLRKPVKIHIAGLFLLSILDFLGLAILLPLLLTLVTGPQNALNPLAKMGIIPPSLTQFALILIAFFSFKTLYYFRIQKKQVTLLASLVKHFSQNNIKQFLTQPYESKSSADSSELIEKAYFQPYFICQGVFVPLFVILQESLILCIISVTLLYFYPFISLSLFVVALGSAWIIKRLFKPYKTYLGSEQTQKRKAMLENLNLNLSAQLDIQQNKLSKQAEETLSCQIQNLVQGDLKSNMVKSLPFRMNELVAVIGLCFLLLIETLFAFDGNLLTLGALFALALFRSIPAINRLQLNWVQLQMYKNHAESYEPYPETQEQELPVAAPQDSIQLRDLHIEYQDRTQTVLKGVNMTFKAGQITVCIGPSGSGKSSMLRVLAGQMTPQSGFLQVDSLPLTPAHLEAWKTHVAYITQKPHILKDSVYANVAFGSDPNYSIPKAQEALRIAGLEELIALPDSYEMGQEGFKISEGQKQRLALARAIYKNTPILLLDEITSNLDSEHSKRVQQALQTLANQGKTIVVISHDQTMCNIAQCVYLFNNQTVIKHENNEYSY